MMRGRVVPDEAQAWTAGLVLATDYFAWARRRAVSKASAAIRSRLDGRRRVRSEDPGTSR
ncbi:MAG TPA: hypothetical protein VFL71_13800 [Actinomycetes bacterium]|jgi:hypothetical protein|nr:hypothetical protein [Actinomycetes bacterium]